MTVSSILHGASDLLAVASVAGAAAGSAAALLPSAGMSGLPSERSSDSLSLSHGERSRAARHT